MDKENVLRILRDNKKNLEEKYGLIKLGIFGSYVRNEQNTNSDIDIVIELNKDNKDLHTFFKLKREIEDLLGIDVDLGIESNLKPVVADQIKKEIIYV